MQNILFFIKKYLKDIIIFVLLLICLGLIIYKYFEPEKETQSIDSIAMLESAKNEENSIKQEVEPSTDYIYVDIKGSVKKPGVYKILNTSIINDAINMAGGFTSSAYQNNINLSKRVCAEMVIYVYSKSEINSLKNSEASATENKSEKAPNKADTENEKTSTANKNDNASDLGSSLNIKTPTNYCETSNYDITKCLDDKNSIITIIDSDSCQETPNTDIKDENNKNNNDKENNNTNSKDLININTADVTLLTTLTGVGEAKAKTIINYREENGNFKTITDIMNVKGIGEKMFETIKDYITV